MGWTDQHENAFVKLKKVAMRATVLIIPAPSKPYYLEVFLSATALATVASKERHGKAGLTYASRRMSPVELKYFICEEYLLVSS